MNRYVPLLLVIALLAAVALKSSPPHGGPDANPLHTLTHARVGRAVTPQLSIPTEYRACTVVSPRDGGTVTAETCGGDDEPALDANAFGSAAETTDPDSLQASALAEVMWGDGGEPILDEAVAGLQKSLRLSRRPVPLLVDLAGAHLVRAQRTQHPRDLVQGLSYAREALEREPANRAARFNAALALQALAIDGEAAKAWDLYLAVDSASPWADEARRRKRAIPKPRAEPPPLSETASAAEAEAFAASDPQTARLRGWETELGEWGKAVLRGDARGARSHLAIAEGLGDALERRGGDATLADAARAIRAASPNRTATRRLARGHRAYAVGWERYWADDFDGALRQFVRVAELRPPSPALLDWAEASRAGMMVVADPAGSDSVFLRLLTRTYTPRQAALAARIRWTRTTQLLRTGRYPEARQQARLAGAAFQRIGENEFLGEMLALGGEAEYEQGDTLAAYSSYHRALLVLRSHPGSPWLHSLLVELAHCTAKDGMRWAAVPVHDEMVAAALLSHDTAKVMEALLTRSRLRAEMGRGDLAAQDMAAAEALLPSFSPGETREWFAADLHFTRGMITPRTDRRSAAALDSAIAFFRHKDVVRLLPLLMHRADARLGLGDTAGAAADLDSATARIRRLSQNEVKPSERAAMIEGARSRFDQLVMLQVNARKEGEALKVLERGRVSFTSERGTAPLARGGEFAAPPGQVAVEYALIGDTLLTWTVRGKDVAFHPQPVDREALLQAVGRVGVALGTPARSAALRSELDRLYDLLVRPIEAYLGPAGTPLVILADGDIAGVPFAALHDARRGRYLVEDHSLRFASTLADARRPALRRAARDTALLVANPAFDPLEYPLLDPLRGARAEADSLLALYPAPMLLAEHGADRAAFTARAQRATVIHYAGHAVFDDALPQRSYLVFAGGRAAGQLTAEAVGSLKLGHVRLVVLSACRTLPSRGGRSGGFAGLSGALLGAGAGGVVGSVWSVDDSLTLPLMVAFHREYVRSGDPAEALRLAQLRQIRSPDPAMRSPAAWAGFRYVGR